MRISKTLLLLSIGFIAQVTPAQENIPHGTIIPVRLNSSLSSQSAYSGLIISGRVMQDVPLGNGTKIQEGTKISGHVIDVKPAAQGIGPSISFTFDRVLASDRGIPVTTNLRALASFVAVEGAQIPQLGMGEGEDWNNRTTVQVGGDTVYWGGGPVVSNTGPVGKPLSGVRNSGVLVRVTAALGSPCQGEIDRNQTLQALWVFSSDACGVYGLSCISIIHAGRTTPVGVIELTSTRRVVKVDSGSGMLLRVIGPSPG